MTGFHKNKKENKKHSFLCAYGNTTTPWITYTRLRALFLTKCHNYPYEKAKMIAESEYELLIEKM